MHAQLVDAMSMRDGGTTQVQLVVQGAPVAYTFDYALPWDGRPRSIIQVEPGKPSTTLLPNDERAVCSLVRDILIKEFGKSTVCAFEADDLKNPGDGPWFYAFGFLGLALRERKVRPLA
jgi:hypothetical protein